MIGVINGLIRDLWTLMRSARFIGLPEMLIETALQRIECIAYHGENKIEVLDNFSIKKVDVL